MKRLTLALIMGVFVTAPAMADLFTFNFGPLISSGDTSTFTANVVDGGANGTTGDVTRVVIPLGAALFDKYWSGPEDFTISMGLNVTSPTVAHGIGSLTITDIDHDKITANVEGDWALPFFTGTLSNILYTPSSAGETTFNGDNGTSALMNFSGPLPGFIIDLNATGVTFTKGWTGKIGAGASGVATPLPGAVLLGLLGLGYAGMRLRKVC